MPIAALAGCGDDGSSGGNGETKTDGQPAFTAADRRQTQQLVRQVLVAEIDKDTEAVCAALSPVGLKRLQAASTTSRFCQPLVAEQIGDPGNPEAGALPAEQAGAQPGFFNPDVESEEVSIVSSAQPEEAKQQMASWNSQVTPAGKRLLVSFGNTPTKAIPVVKTARGLKLDSLPAVPLPASFTAPSRKIVPCMQRGLGQRSTGLQREMEREGDVGPVAYYSFELGQDQDGKGGGMLEVRVANSEAAAKHVLAGQNGPRGEVDEETGELSRQVPDPLPAARYGSLVTSSAGDALEEDPRPPEGQDLALIKRCGQQAGISGL